MGLSPLLVDTYRRYKRDTKAFTQWLGATAQATGLINDVLENETADKHPSKTKGKKGRNQKSRKKFGAYKVPVHVLIELANAVKEAKVSRVPRHILSILKDVISARKGCAAWYRAHQTDESDVTKQHNNGHRHIIEVFEEVYQILLPLAEDVVSDDGSQTAKTADIVNVFGLLEVEECPDMETEDNWVPLPTKKLTRDTYEPEPSPEDVSFALYCFMKDLTDIRIFIRRTWREYKHKHITLNTAATTTNAAIDTMRRLNEAFVQDHPAFKEHRSLIEYLYDEYVDPNMDDVNAPNVQDFATYQGDGVRLSSKTFFCDHTTAILLKFYSNATLPMYQMRGSFGASAEEESLCQCLSHLNIVDTQVNNIEERDHEETVWQMDQILKAVHIMRVDKKFPTWAIFACQVFVDTRRELGSRLAAGLEDLQKEWQWLRQSWSTCMENGKGSRVNKFHEVNDDSIRQHITAFTAAVEEDAVQSMLDDCFEEHPGTSAKYTWGNYFLFRNHPLLCGVLLQQALIFGLSMGTRIAADQGPVRSAIHMSHAITLAGLNPSGKAWADLDYIIKKHGDAYLFVGERPNTIVECYRRMSLAFGSSASEFSVNKSGKVDSRYLKQQRDPPSIQKFHRRLLPMARYVNTVSKRTGHKIVITRAAQEPFILIEHLVNRIINSDDLSCPANPFNEKETNKPHFLTPLQSLTIFKQALKEDDLPLRFDLMSLNWRCIQLFRRVQKICVEESPLDYPAKRWGGDHYINAFLNYMLAGVAGVERQQPTRFLELCILFDDIIAKQGNVEVLAAQARAGIVKGAIRLEEVDTEDFEDPDVNFVPFHLRQDIKQLSAEEIALLRSRA